MLQVKFFKVSSGNFYVKVRDLSFDNVELDCTWLKNVWEHTAPYIQTVMTWGYRRGEIEFVLDPTLDNDAAESISRDIAIYADEV